MALSCFDTKYIDYMPFGKGLFWMRSRGRFSGQGCTPRHRRLHFHLPAASCSQPPTHPPHPNKSPALQFLIASPRSLDLLTGMGSPLTGTPHLHRSAIFTGQHRSVPTTIGVAPLTRLVGAFRSRPAHSAAQRPASSRGFSPGAGQFGPGGSPSCEAAELVQHFPRRWRRINLGVGVGVACPSCAGHRPPCSPSAARCIRTYSRPEAEAFLPRYPWAPAVSAAHSPTGTPIPAPPCTLTVAASNFCGRHTANPVVHAHGCILSNEGHLRWASGRGVGRQIARPEAMGKLRELRHAKPDCQWVDSIAEQAQSP